MTLETIELESGPNPVASVIWLHGLGADGNDFVPIVHELDLAGMAPIRFVFPHAPMIPVTINDGYVMRAWYDIIGNDQNMGKREDEAGLRQSREAIEELIEREIARGVPASRIVLAGFSQGCAVTLMTGLRCSKRLAGLACLSGYLPLAPLTGHERHAANADVPIFMAHGTQDAVIYIKRAEESRNALSLLGYEVAWHPYPMAHSVCAEEIADLSDWFRSVLPTA